MGAGREVRKLIAWGLLFVLGAEQAQGLPLGALLAVLSIPEAHAVPTASNGCTFRHQDYPNEAWNGVCAPYVGPAGSEIPDGYTRKNGRLEVTGWGLVTEPGGDSRVHCPRQDLLNCVMEARHACSALYGPSVAAQEAHHACLKNALKGAAKSVQRETDAAIRLFRPATTVQLGALAQTHPECTHTTRASATRVGIEQMKENFCLRYASRALHEALDSGDAASRSPAVAALVRAECGASPSAACVNELKAAAAQAFYRFGEATSGLNAINRAGAECEEAIPTSAHAVCWEAIDELIPTVPFDDIRSYFQQGTARSSGSGGSGTRGKGRGAKGAAGAGGTAAGTGGSGGGSTGGDGVGTGTGVGAGRASGAAPAPSLASPTPRPSASRSVGVPGVSGGVPGGLGCGTQPDGTRIDCRLMSEVPVDDYWGSGYDTVAQCPDYLRPYNCMATGTGLRGDPVLAPDSPEFPRVRERACQTELRRLRPMDPVVQRLLDGADPQACQYLTVTLGRPDPMPRLSRDEMARAIREEGNAQHAGAMASAQVVLEAGLYRDLGAFSIQQKVRELFAVAANLDPTVITGGNAASGAFARKVEELVGAASCLATAEKDELRAQLDELRLQGARQSEQLTSRKNALDREWVADLEDKAQKVLKLDEVEFNFRRLWAQLSCDQNYFEGTHIDGIRQTTLQCLDSNYRTITDRSERVSAAVYADRVRWVRELLPEALVDVPDDPTLTPDINRSTYGARRAEALARARAYYRDHALSGPPEGGEAGTCQLRMSCNDIVGYFRTANRRKTALLSNYPLLAEKTGSRVARADCSGTPGQISGRKVSLADQAKRIEQFNQETGVVPPIVRDLANAAASDACDRDQTLADRLVGQRGDPARQLASAREASGDVYSDTLAEIRRTCAKGDSGLAAEGRDAGELVSERFMACEDVGSSSQACADRRSFGWAMCWDFMRDVAKKNRAHYMAFFRNLAMAAGGVLAGLATFGGGWAALAAGGFGVATSGYSIYSRHEELDELRERAHGTRQDFRRRWASYDQFQRDWNAMDQAEKDLVSGDIFDGVMIFLDAASLPGAIRAVRQGRASQALERALREGRGAEAFRQARTMREGPELVRYARGRGVVDGVDVGEEFVQGMKRGLRHYGPHVASLSDEALGSLYNLEQKIGRALDDGTISAATAARMRSEASGLLRRPCG